MAVLRFLESFHGDLAGKDLHLNSTLSQLESDSTPLLSIEAVVVVDGHHVVLIKRVFDLRGNHQLAGIGLWSTYMYMNHNLSVHVLYTSKKVYIYRI